MHKRPLIYCLLLLLSLTGCNDVVLLPHLSERDSRELILALEKNSITSSREREPGREMLYQVVVDPASVTRAMQIATELALPRKDSAEELNKLLNSNGLLPLTPDLERMKFDRALAVDLERQILTTPGVVIASVLIRSKVDNRFSSEPPPRAVRINIATTGAKLEEGKLKELVRDAVPGSSADGTKIDQVIFPHQTLAHSPLATDETTVLNIRVASTDRLRLWILFGGISGLMLLFGVILGRVLGAGRGKAKVANRGKASGAVSIGGESFFDESHRSIEGKRG